MHDVGQDLDVLANQQRPGECNGDPDKASLIRQVDPSGAEPSPGPDLLDRVL